LLITVEKQGFDTLGRGELLGAKTSVWLFAATAVVLGLVLHRTTFGRYIFAAGGNAEALRLSGVRVGLVRAGTYAIIGLAAGLAGVIAASRVSTGQADAGGYDLLFDVFAAVIIGGTSLMGGDGAIWRTLIGLALVAMIGNGFNLLSVDPVYQRILFGTIILVAVAVDAWARRSRT
jgi:ribose transport system permease protein